MEICSLGDAGWVVGQVRACGSWNGELRGPLSSTTPRTFTTFDNATMSSVPSTRPSADSQPAPLKTSQHALDTTVERDEFEARDTLSPLPGDPDTATIAAPVSMPQAPNSGGSQPKDPFTSSQHSRRGTGDTRRSTTSQAHRTPVIPPTTTSHHPQTISPSKFILYENKRRFYIISSDSTDSYHRLLRIDRTTPGDKELEVVEDDTVYDTRQMEGVLKMIEEGNKGSASGGLNKSQVFYGIAGKCAT